MAESVMMVLALIWVGVGTVCVLLGARLVLMGSRIEGFAPAVGIVTNGLVTPQPKGRYTVALWYQYGAGGTLLTGSNMRPGSFREEFSDPEEALAALEERTRWPRLDVLVNPKRPEEAVLAPTPAKRWAKAGALMGGLGLAILFYAMQLWLGALGSNTGFI
ncbi:MAG: hypothetical protein MRY63_07220 [Neomegalonema sp.]|nr:hypothetical protein [Neomegalonema sp.]